MPCPVFFLLNKNEFQKAHVGIYEASTIFTAVFEPTPSGRRHFDRQENFFCLRHTNSAFDCICHGSSLISSKQGENIQWSVEVRC